MKLNKILFCSVLFILSSLLLSAQEHHDHVAPLRCNPVLVKLTNEAKRKHTVSWRLISDSIMAKLPFLDDFSHGGPYPNDTLWMDNAAFINNTMPICPHTLGVATLDGVNSEGQPYNPLCPPGSSYPADSLTSRPFDLTTYAPFDSLWLSFYWQAGGLGYAPKPADTLLLQFRTNGIPWTTVWYHTGYTPSPPDTGMHLVMVPIKSAAWFDHNFQFRFKNYACTSANVDQWNIDEVFMKDHRQWSDTAQPDVSFGYEAPSLLANYQYMPWEQFTANDLRDSMFIFERNNSATAPINMTYSCTISTTPPSTYSGGAANMNEFSIDGWSTNKSQTHIPVKPIYNFNSLSGPTDITMTHVLSSPGDFIPANDTLRFDQIFSDYYAYDDGTAEAAYFINGPTPMYLAYGFTLNKADTLRGLDLYFNYLFVNPSSYSFRLALWDNSGPGGSPGVMKFENDTIYSPSFNDSLNGFVFYPYHFSHDSAVSGTFYVGWVQTYGDSLNIGWDYNTNSENQIYYNISGIWYPGNYAGSMMMRPVFGNRNAHAPILQTTTVKDSYEALSIYPNPAKDEVNLSQAMPANTTLRIYTADGREFLRNTAFYGNSINTASLPAGFYIVELTNPTGKAFYQKLLIER